MKTKYLYPVGVAALAVISLAAMSTPREVRPYPPPNVGDEIAADPKWKILPREEVYEVGRSKIDWSSIRDLPPSGYRKLTQARAKGYTGAYYVCPPGKTP